jgi:molybdopterin synthase catalytic subunit
VDHVQLTHEPLSADLLIRNISLASAGALVIFHGVVRDNNLGRAVQYLDYDAYPEMAERELRRIAAQARAEFDLERISIAHRLGRIEIGEASLLVAVSAAHRAAAFTACHAVVDRIKQTVPIWKKEFWEDGSHWVEGPSHPQQAEIAAP